MGSDSASLVFETAIVMGPRDADRPDKTDAVGGGRWALGGANLDRTPRPALSI